MAIKKGNRDQARYAKVLQKQIKDLGKKIAAYKKDVKSPWALVVKYIDPIQVAFLFIIVVIDIVLGLLGVITFGLIDFVDWIINIPAYIFIALMTVVMLMTAIASGASIPLLILSFIVTFVIELTPELSDLPAMTAFSLLLVMTINRAKVMTKLKRSKKQLATAKKNMQALTGSSGTKSGIKGKGLGRITSASRKDNRKVIAQEVVGSLSGSPVKGSINKN